MEGAIRRGAAVLEWGPSRVEKIAYHCSVTLANGKIMTHGPICNIPRKLVAMAESIE